MRKLAWVSITLLTVLGALGGTAYYVLFTKEGLDWTLRKAEQVTPGELSIGRAVGHLTDTLTLGEVSYRNESLHITMDTLSLSWLPGALLKKKLDITRIAADGVTITMFKAADTPVEPETPPLVLPTIQLPVDIRLADVDITNLNVKDDHSDELFRLDSLRVAATYREHTFYLQKLSIDAPLITAELAGKVTPQNTYPLALTAIFTLRPAELAAFKGTLSVDGNLDQLTIRNTVSEPFQSTLQGSLNEILTTPRWVASLDVASFSSAKIHPDWESIDLKGRIENRGNIDVFDLDINTEVLYQQERIDLDAQARYDHGTWRIGSLIAALPHYGTRASAQGEVVFNDHEQTAKLAGTWQNLRWPLAGTPTVASKSGHYTIDGNLERYTLNATADLDVEHVPFNKVAVKGHGSLSEFHARSLSATNDDFAALQVGGSVQWDPAVKFRVNGRWTHLAWPTLQTAQVMSSQGKITLNGAPNDYAFSVDAALSGPNFPPGQWRMSGQGSNVDAYFEKIHGKLLDGHVDTALQLQWSPEVAWYINGVGENINPGTYWPDLPGQIGFALNGSGAMLEGVYSADFSLDHASGTLKRLPVNVHSNVAVENGHISISPFVAVAGDSSLVVSGEISDQWTLSWRADAPTLGTLIEDLGGTLYAQGSLAGEKHNPTVAMTVDGDQLHYGAQRIDNLNVELEWDPADVKTSFADIHANNIDLNEIVLHQVSIQGRGRASDHVVDLWVDGGERAMSGRIKGDYTEDVWQGIFSDMRIRLPTVGTLHAPRSDPIVASPDHATLPLWCLVSEIDAKFCLDAAWTKTTGWQANARVEKLPLDVVEPWMPPDIDLDGSVAINAHAQHTRDTQLIANVELSSKTGQIEFEATRDHRVPLPYHDLVITGQLNQGISTLSVSTDLAERGHMDGKLRLPISALEPEDDAIEGTFDASLKEIGMLSLLIPDAENPKGNLEIDLRLAGTLVQPTHDLKLVISDGAMDLPVLGTQIRQTSFTAHSNENGTISFQGKSHSGPGFFTLTGQLDPNPSGEWLLDANIGGENFRAMDTREFRVTVSPDLDIKMSHDMADISGSVLIVDSRVRPQDLSTAKRPSSDVVIVSDTDNGDASTRFRLTSNVRLKFGDDVWLNAFGLRGLLAGELSVFDEPGQLTRGRGEIRVVDGTFKAYGQNLSIERGRLIFVGGPIDNPGLDVRAIREVGDVVAGLHLKGRVSDPELKVFSQPAMSETEALSYIIRGRPLQSSGTGEDAETSAAGTALTIGGANLLTGALGENIGLDEFGFETKSDTGEVSLKLGQYVSPKLFVGYSRGLVEEINTILVRYHLTNRLAIETQSSTEQMGGDLLLMFERK